MKAALVIGTAIFFSAITPTTTVLAASCSSLAEACLRHEAAMGKNAAARCNPAKRACLRRCKAGKAAYFVGPSTGRAYPADTCK